MATNPATAAQIEAHLAGAGDVRTKKMFGEYGVYLDEKLVGAIADDQLFLKITSGSRPLLDESHDAPPYPGASLHHLIPAEKLEDEAWLHKVIRQVADDLPMPKPKKKKPIS